MSKLLAVDLDGTLFYPKQRRRLVPKKNVEFLQKWIDAGNSVVLVSSRSYSFTSQILKEINRPVDFINHLGGQIRINNKIVKDVWIDNKILKEVLDSIRHEFDTLGFMSSTEKYPLVIRDNQGLSKLFVILYRLWYFFQGKYREKYITSNEIFDDQVEKGKVYLTRVLFGIKKRKSEIAKELNKKFRDAYPEIEFSWTDIIIEMTPAGCSKSESLKFYVEKKGFKNDDVYVVGDSGNDISMFTEFKEHSYCMAHSYSSVKKYAKNIISRVHNLDKLL